MTGLSLLLLSLSTLIPMVQPRSLPAAVALPDGRVLVAGGNWSTRTIEMFDPAAGAFVELNDASVARTAPSGTLLPDGRVLVAAGGAFPDFRGFPFGEYGDPSTVIFNPSTEALTAGPNLLHRRDHHSATLLPDGRVLFAGGENRSVGGFHYLVYSISLAEVLDPSGDFLTEAPPLLTPRSGHAAVSLGDGRVLMIGGAAEGEPVAELYDEAAATSVPVAGLEPRMSGVVATRLLDGRVLISGGTAAGLIPPAEVYDPLLGTVMKIDSALGRRTGATGTLLPDGDVLLAGGTYDLQTPISDVALFSVACGCFRSMPSLMVPRAYHSTVALPGGNLLMIAGGRADAEIYSRPRRTRAIAR